MASQTRSAGLGQSLIFGGKPWSSPTNIYASDDADASCNLPLGQSSYWLQATTFGFAIPIGATIDGISVYIERQCNRASAVQDNSVQIIKAGSRVGANKRKATFWETTDTSTLYGGSTDKWGQTWTPAQINASNFGVATSAINSWLDVNTTYARVDHIYIIVHYTEPSTNMKVNIGDVFKDVSEIKINVGDSWKTVTKIQINVGDVWKTVFGS